MHPSLRRLRALVLHRTPLRENDRVVEVFSREEGRLRLLAAGVRRIPSRRAGHLEPFMESQLVVARSSRGDAVREARVLQTFPRLREEFSRLRVAYTLAHLLRAFTGEGVRDVRLYDAMLHILTRVDAPSELRPLLIESAQIHVLRSLGALPDLYRCTHCRRPLRANAFSQQRSRRGFWCLSCGGVRDETITGVVKVLRVLLQEPVPRRPLRVPGTVHRRLEGTLTELFRSQALSSEVRSPL